MSEQGAEQGFYPWAMRVSIPRPLPCEIGPAVSRDVRCRPKCSMSCDLISWQLSLLRGDSSAPADFLRTRMGTAVSLRYT